MVGQSSSMQVNAPMWGVFGGSFDPVHIGHIQTAASVIEQLSLDKMLLVPAARSPFKGRSHADNEQRAQMLELAIEGHTKFILDQRELKQPPPSYTVNTLEAIKQEKPNAHLVLILGMDAWLSFDQWRQPERILQLAHIAVMTRPGYTQQADAAFSALDQKSKNSLSLRKQQAGQIMFLDVPAIDVSSTAIRKAYKKNITDVVGVAPKVNDYIEHHQLYR